MGSCCSSPDFKAENRDKISRKQFLFPFFGGGVAPVACWKFPGQGSNPRHSSDPRCCKDNPGSLTHCATRELQRTVSLKRKEKDNAVSRFKAVPGIHSVDSARRPTGTTSFFSRCPAFAPYLCEVSLGRSLHSLFTLGGDISNLLMLQIRKPK